MNDHLHKRQHQGLLNAQKFLRMLVALEQLRREGAVFAARYLKGELPHAGGQLSLVGAVPVAGSLLAALVAVYAQMIGHLGLKNLIEDLLHQQIFASIAEQDLFEFLVA
ncbi:hypothetical protein GGP88_003027 [Salinibacter ruber]|nr:hypothetical protein [Salinibacter ruber]MCS3785453.1 hypothetical protein [Salinibacter ruber]